MLRTVIDGAKSGGSSKRLKEGQREGEHYETGIEKSCLHPEHQHIWPCPLDLCLPTSLAYSAGSFIV